MITNKRAKKLKVKTIFKALEKNGLPWGTGGLYEDSVGRYCAIGQAAHNLKVDPSQLHYALDELIPPTITEDEWVIAGGSLITRFNDYNADSYADVVEFAKKLLEPHFDESILIRKGTDDV